jgi:hypothetical protein
MKQIHNHTTKIQRNDWALCPTVSPISTMRYFGLENKTNTE